MNIKRKLTSGKKTKMVSRRKKSIILSTFFILSVACNLFFIFHMEKTNNHGTTNKLYANAASTEDVTLNDEINEIIENETNNDSIINDSVDSLHEETIQTYTSVEARAATQVSVDYVKSKIVIKSTTGSTKFYISKDKQKSWELLNSNVSQNSIELELAAYMKTSDVVLYFKGDKDLTPVELKIPKEEANLKVTYKVANSRGMLVFENPKGGALEYRTSATGYWMDHNSNVFYTDAYDDTGMTLQFRTKATANKRAGKIINAKIPKRPTAPSVKVDFKKMMITGLKKGVTEYRIGSNTKWETFNPKDSKTQGLSLYDILSNGTVSNTTLLNANSIEFRNIADGKKVSSAVRMLDFNQQAPAPNMNSFLNGSTLTIPDASKDKPYEYLVLQSTELLNMDVRTAKWMKVTSPKSILIKKTGNTITVPTNVVFVRLAAVTDKQTSKLTPPSLYSQKVIEKLTN